MTVTRDIPAEGSTAAKPLLPLFQDIGDTDTFDPFKIDKNHEFDIADLSIRLSRIPRWSGGGRCVIPVAAHSMAVANTFVGLDNKAVLYALLHDVEEAYTGDIPVPIKRCMSIGFRDMALNLRTAIRRSVTGTDVPEEDIRLPLAMLDRLMYAVDKVIMPRLESVVLGFVAIDDSDVLTVARGITAPTEEWITRLISNSLSEEDFALFGENILAGCRTLLRAILFVDEYGAGAFARVFMNTLVAFREGRVKPSSGTDIGRETERLLRELAKGTDAIADFTAAAYFG